MKKKKNFLLSIGYLNGDFLSLTFNLLSLIYKYLSYFHLCDFRSTKFLNTDPIWIRIHKTSYYMYLAFKFGRFNVSPLQFHCCKNIW